MSPILLDRLRVVQCFQITVQDSPEGPHTQSIQILPITPAFYNETLQPRMPVPASFRVINANIFQPDTGLKDSPVMILKPLGNWHQRQRAKQIEKGI